MPSSVADLNRITNTVLGAAIEVHRLLGPGLLESAYQQCLAWELQQKDLYVEQQVVIPSGFSLNMDIERICWSSMN